MHYTGATDPDSLYYIYDLDEGRVLGSGFTFIKENWVATAKHVVFKEGIPRRSIGVRNLSKLQSPKVFAEAQVLTVHPECDAVILNIDAELHRYQPFLPSWGGMQGGVPFFCIGYSPSMTRRDNKNTLLSSLIKSYQWEYRERRTCTEHVIVFESSEIEGGHSGGPVFAFDNVDTHSGRANSGVVGMIIEGYKIEDIYYGKATSVLTLIDILPERILFVQNNEND